MHVTAPSQNELSNPFWDSNEIPHIPNLFRFALQLLFLYGCGFEESVGIALCSAALCFRALADVILLVAPRIQASWTLPFCVLWSTSCVTSIISTAFSFIISYATSLRYRNFSSSDSEARCTSMSLNWWEDAASCLPIPRASLDISRINVV